MCGLVYQNENEQCYYIYKKKLSKNAIKYFVSLFSIGIAFYTLLFLMVHV